MTRTPRDPVYQHRTEQLLKLLRARPAGPMHLGKKTSNLFRRRREEASRRIDVSDFSHVLTIDPRAKTADVEGMVTYEQLVAATLPHQLVPAVTPELKTITVGGAISGIGIESSCFKYGFVHETVLELDVLTGDGRILACSSTEHPDLFFGMPNSYGTLGYVLRAKLLLVPAKPYIKIERQTFTDLNQYVEAMVAAATTARRDGRYDYIDGLVFPPKTAYLNLAKFVDEAPFVSDYTYLNIFYRSFPKKSVDYLTTSDYLFRYDTDWFWTTKLFGLENPFLRVLWGKQRLRSDVYHKLMRWSQRQAWLQKLPIFEGTETLIQDAEVPLPRATEFLEWLLESIPVREPVVVAPVIPYHPSRHWTLFPMDPTQVSLNIGHYAPVPSNQPKGYYTRLFDRKVLEFGALKMLYSDSSFTKDEFWQLFDQEAYEALKRTYDPDGCLKGLYEKVVLKA